MTIRYGLGIAPPCAVCDSAHGGRYLIQGLGRVCLECWHEKAQPGVAGDLWNSPKQRQEREAEEALALAQHTPVVRRSDVLVRKGCPRCGRDVNWTWEHDRPPGWWEGACLTGCGYLAFRPEARDSGGQEVA